MKIDLLEWSLSCIFVPHEQHPNHPEEENIMACLEDICRIVFLEEFSRILEVPVKDREWPEGTGKPGIKYILVTSYMIYIKIQTLFILSFLRMQGLGRL